MQILQPSDRHKISIGEIDLIISPLTFGQQIATSVNISSFGGIPYAKMKKINFLIVKNCLREIKGLEDIHDEPFCLEFEEKQFNTCDGETETSQVLTDQCARTVISCLALDKKLDSICWQLIEKIPDCLIDENGKEIKGVKIEPLGKPETSKGKKKR